MSLNSSSRSASCCKSTLYLNIPERKKNNYNVLSFYSLLNSKFKSNMINQY